MRSKTYLDLLDADTLNIITDHVFHTMEDYDEMEDNLRYLCYKIYEKDPENYSGEWKYEFDFE